MQKYSKPLFELAHEDEKDNVTDLSGAKTEKDANLAGITLAPGKDQNEGVVLNDPSDLISPPINPPDYPQDDDD